MWNRRIELGLLMPIAQVWIHGSPLTAKIVPQVPAAAEFNRGVVARFLTWFDRELDGHAFLVGDAYSVADVTALCTLDFATGLVGIAVDPALENVARWHAAVSSRPSAKA